MAAPTPNSLGVRLHSSEERAIWNRLAALPCFPSRYPEEETLERMGIKQCFWELAEAGGLTQLFKSDAETYRGLTLEFLTTLRVETTDEGIVWRIYFRLQNEEHMLEIDDISQIFDSHGMNVFEPPEYDATAFWHSITLQENQNLRYSAARAKGSEIRNPALRYMHKALAWFPFGRTETGVVQSAELFTLWSLLKKRPILIGHYMMKHLEVQAAKTRGSLSCGGIISVIAAHVGVDLDELEPVPGDMEINLDVLRNARFWQIDTDRQGFFIQKANDNFPFPNAQLTYVNGWEYKANWLMNTPEHRRVIAETPRKQWQSSRIYPMNIPYVSPWGVPRVGIPPQYPEGQDEAAAEVPQQEQRMDLVIQPEVREARHEETHRGESHRGESSRTGARRTRGDVADSELEEMNRRMDELQVSVQEMRDEQNAHWDTYIAQRLDDLHWRTEQNAHWATYYAHRQEDLHWRQEQRQEDRDWRAQQEAHWATYTANQQAEQEWRQQMQNAWFAQFPPAPPQ